jgi:spermidine dehydrogenase
MPVHITRRDFLNGIAVGAGASLLAPTELFAEGSLTAPAPGAPSVVYPPTLTGMRGSHEGSYEVAHALAWRGEKPAEYRALDEHYDLIVVGAGMSGLGAAWFYRKKMGPDARILLLDNHDDFGGHAKRNEFHHDGRMLVSLAGAQNLENPSSYSDVAASVITDLGIDTDAMGANMTAAHGLCDPNADNAMSLPGPEGQVTVGGSWMLLMLGKGDYVSAVRALPLPSAEQDRLIELFGGDRDYLDELSLQEKYAYAKTTSYNQFLTERVGLGEESLAILNAQLLIYIGATGWNLSVLEALAAGAPGLQGMGWLAGMANSLAASFAGSIFEVRIFPDGNASVARLLVHKLIPDAAPGSTGFADIAATRFDYGALDRVGQPTRLRLDSTVVGAREVEGGRVEVDYVQKGESLRVTGSHCILACYNGIIPHLCPELPDAQKEALRYGVKVPFVYANVVLRNGRAFSKLGATRVTCPEDPFIMMASAPPTTTGGYEPPRGPDDPMVVLMMASPTPAPQGEETARDLFRLGRHQIYSTAFAAYEQQIRDQLQALLGQHGFDHEADIRAITVNRIPHGYAYSYMALDDPEWAEGQAPHEIGRAQFGRISIANSDSEARAYLDAAVDAAWRAVEEQTAGAA